MALLWRFFGTVLFYAFAEGGTRDDYTTAFIFSGEAHGFGCLSVTSVLQILVQCDLTDYDICFVQIGENDVKTAKDDSLGLNNHELMHALINIVEEFHRVYVKCLAPFSLDTRACTASEATGSTSC